jgi:hypothetical protein
MVMEREMDGDDGGGATVPLSSHKMDLRSVQLFLWRLSCLRRLYCKLYIGAFTKIAWIDLTKTVAGGMGGLCPYQCSPDLLMLGFAASQT